MQGGKKQNKTSLTNQLDQINLFAAGLLSRFTIGLIILLLFMNSPKAD